MITSRILLAASAIFLAAALVRWVRAGRKLDGSSRTWFIIALMFGGVAAWLLAA